MKIGVIIVAAGSGSRMGGPLPKQFLPLAGEPIVERTLRRMRAFLPEAEVVIVLPKEYVARYPGACAGGATRFASVGNALRQLSEDCELIVVHDGVRPFFSEKLLRRVIEAAADKGAAIPVVEPVDSLRRLTEAGSEPVDRAAYACVQTPQAFRAELLRRAYAQDFDPAFTDDASVIEALGAPVALVEGERRNIKITTPDDLLVAEIFLNDETL